jgi:hypothetical protein
MSLSSLLNNHINLFLSDNSGKNLLFILEKKVFLAKEYLLHFTNRNENKLRTYCKFKFIIQQEKYLDTIKELSYRSTLARFRISAHKLEIERVLN